jgi:hypothetical protein
MFNYRLNTVVLNKIDLKIIHYFLHQFSLRLPVFFGI